MYNVKEFAVSAHLLCLGSSKVEGSGLITEGSGGLLPALF